MKRLLNLFVGVILGTMLISGTAFAYNALEHVTVAPGGKGDAGIFPVYIAFDGGWRTKLEIINTSGEYSTVAKVVVRTHKYSQEVLDFFIFLSPTDVWTGYLEYGPKGARLYSTDGSCLAGTRATGPKIGKWASVADPMDVELADIACDTNEMGYVEVIEGWHTNQPPLNAPPVDKDDIYAWWWNTALNQPIAAELGTLNSLAMHYEITLGMFQGADRATVLRDYDVIGAGLTLGVETFLGDSAGGPSRNTGCEVEAALSKLEIAMPYYNDLLTAGLTTLHFLTFPTKYTILNDDCTIFDVRSDFFKDNTTASRDWCIDYGFYFWDLEENSVNPPGSYSPVPPSLTREFCDELNMVSVAAEDLGFDEGWIMYQFVDGTSCTPKVGVPQAVGFSGAPVIPVTLLVNLNAGEYGMSLLSGAWTDGYVQYSADGLINTYEPFYHYGPYPNALSVPTPIAPVFVLP